MSVTHRKNKSSLTVMDSNNYEAEKDYKQLLKNYEQSIIIMTKNLEQKENIITKMTNEIEEYEVEFKEMCSHNSKLKKELYESNNHIHTLENKIKELIEINELLEESENSNQTIILPLKNKIYETEKNYNDLQVRFSKLLIESTNQIHNNTDIKNKNIFKVKNKKIKRNNFKRRIRIKEKRINKLIKTLKSKSIEYKDNELKENISDVINITIKDLNDQIKVLSDIIEERDFFIKDIQQKFDETLKIVDSQNTDIKRYRKQLEALQDLEISFFKLQKLIEDRMNKQQLKENKLIYEINDDNKEDKEKHLNERRNKMKKIKIFSDRTGRDMASIMKNLDPISFAVENICKPYASLNEILKDVYSGVNNLKENDLVVIMIGDYKYDYNWNQYLVDINKLCKLCNSKKITLFLSSILYSNHTNEYSQKIYKINKGLYNILNGYNNGVYIDVNKIIFINDKNKNDINVNIRDKISICKFIKNCNINQNISNLNFIKCDHKGDVSLDSNAHNFLGKRKTCIKTV